MTKYLSILFAGETDPGNDCAFFLPTTTSIIQLITSNNNMDLRLSGIIRAISNICINARIKCAIDALPCPE